ncbi:MAG: hypothetical protein Q9173_005368 [Seirophora scorigena]
MNSSWSLPDAAHPLPPIPPLFADRLQGRQSPPIFIQRAKKDNTACQVLRAASFEAGDDAHLRKISRESESSEDWPSTVEPSPYSGRQSPTEPAHSLPVTQTIPHRQRPDAEQSHTLQEPQSAVVLNVGDHDVSDSSNGRNGLHSREPSGDSYTEETPPAELKHPFQYHHDHFDENSGIRLKDGGPQRPHFMPRASEPSQLLTIGNESSTRLAPSRRSALPRPSSAYSSTSDLAYRNRSPQRSPNNLSHLSPASSAHTADSRPVSYIDLINVPYPQPSPAPTKIDNAHLQKAVGNNASLLSTKQTLDMYRANVKKTNDPTIQYEFAIFMVQTAQGASVSSNEGLDGSQSDSSASAESRVDLLREARQILQKLSDRSYPFAQYYLADGYASGLFSKGKEDYDRAFPLFIAASKHGHAEAGYRAALCYEFAWGTRKDPPKAAQFFRQAASKNHPGAASRLGKACLVGDLGQGVRYKEGIKWLKRAAESADFQYNSAPYELGLLHETGYGDDVFLDESYAAQLFTQSADLGHMDAGYRLGDAYEHGKLSCPRDPALSVHFYTGAAQKGHPLALMALCAWYMVGAPPVLEKDENEAYEWAQKAADTGLPKAEYAVGYFTEMGIGCRRDPLEANVWYVRAADHGDERAKHRIAAIRAAASGGVPPPSKQTVPERGTQADLEAFHQAHFEDKPSIASGGAHSIPIAVDTVEYGGEEVVEDDLGYYPDGVKRTLTDEQITMFRNSEIYSILRRRQLQKENEDADERVGTYPEAANLQPVSLDRRPEQNLGNAIRSSEIIGKDEAGSEPVKKQKRSVGWEGCRHSEAASSRRAIRELDGTSTSVDYLDYGEAPGVCQIGAGTTPPEKSAAQTKPGHAEDGVQSDSHPSEPENAQIPKQGKRIWWPTIG